MSKIIKNGDLSKIQKKQLKANPTFVVKCRDCGCEFTYTRNEVKEEMIDILEKWYHIDCPCCGKKITHHWWRKRYKGDSECSSH